MASSRLRDEPIAGPTPSPNRGVYIQPFPPTGEFHQVPKERIDFHPVWVSSDKLLYVPTVGRFSSVAVQTTPKITFGTPTDRPVNIRHDRISSVMRDFDVLTDGRLIITTAATSQNPNRYRHPTARRPELVEVVQRGGEIGIGTWRVSIDV
jgi:hypothetical protein